MSLVLVSYPYCPGHLLDNHAFLLSNQPGEELAELSCSNQEICIVWFIAIPQEWSCSWTASRRIFANNHNKLLEVLLWGSDTGMMRWCPTLKCTTRHLPHVHSNRYSWLYLMLKMARHLDIPTVRHLRQSLTPKLNMHKSRPWFVQSHVWHFWILRRARSLCAIWLQPSSLRPRPFPQPTCKRANAWPLRYRLMIPAPRHCFGWQETAWVFLALEQWYFVQHWRCAQRMFDLKIWMQFAVCRVRWHFPCIN